jgi:phage gp16-like protein
MTRALVKLVHVGCRELGIDAETRRDLQLLVTGKASTTEMTQADLTKLVQALKDRGFAPSGGAKAKRPAASRGDVRFCHVLWGKLLAAGAVTQPGAAGLNAFIRARFEKRWGAVPIDIDTMQDWQQIATVIEALKAMCVRAGVVL